MNILGISAFYHDSAAALVKDGEIIAAAQEERFTRKKHDSSFPKNAVQYCLKEGGIGIGDIDYVAFYEKPFIKFERILETYIAYAPSGISSFLKALPLWIKKKLWMKEMIREELGYSGPMIFPEHHEAHAASAFFPSPYREAAVLTMDGVGEWTTASFGTGVGNSLSLKAEIKFPHSLGLLYSAFTYYTGFKVNSGEYKVMGLAPYGRPVYYDLIMRELLDLKDDGSFKLNMKYFNYCAGLTMTSARFHKLFGGAPRKPESKITQREMDLARSIQDVTEEIMLRMARHVHKVTGKDYLTLGGGVALNCVGNGRILREGPFKGIWIQPASGDAGGALGAALFTWYQYLGNPRAADDRDDLQKGSFLGPVYDNDYIEKYLKEKGAPYVRLSDADVPKKIAELIGSEKVVGWMEGRMEFGPRALGGRSILGDARSARMQETMNLKIKFRESFRPFAPSILAEKAGEYFDIKSQSPYMLLVAPVKESKRLPVSAQSEKLFGLERLNVSRSSIPAVTHVDYSARVQTISRKHNPLFYDMIKAFDEKYGCPVVINTSFNVRGEPIVASPEDAYRCFMRTNMDYLVMGSFLLEKKDQKPLDKDADWLKEYELD
ncbi:MAG: carbamoyltransferase [Candidatus Omnitrophica bacterium]|nr:carbamoyltransferase [Candidatus Omnitrophota bacterium]